MSSEDTSFVLTAVDKTKEAFESVKENFNQAKEHIFSWQEAVLAAVGIGGLGEMVKSAFEAGDQLGKLSDRLGISTENLAAFNLMAAKGGANQEEFTNALEKMTKSIGDAERGTGKAASMFKDMGINVQEFSRLSADKQFEEIAQKIAAMGTQAEKTSAATAIFGKSSYDLLNILQTGAAGLEDARKKTEEYGTALSRVDTAKLEQANESMIEVKEAIKGIVDQIAIALAPYLKAVAEYFTDAAAKGHGFKDEAGSAVEYVAKAVGFLADMIHGLGVVWAAVQVAFTAIAQSIVQVFVSIQTTIQGIMLTIEEDINSVIDKINSITGATIPKIDTSGLKASIDNANGFLDEMKKNTNAAVNNLQKKLAEPMPSDAIGAYFDKVKTETEKAAEATAAAHKKMMDDQAKSAPPGLSDKDKAALEKSLKEIEKIERTAIGEENALYAQRQADLKKALDAGLIDQTRYQNDVEKLSAEHERKLTALAKQGVKTREDFMSLSYKDQTTMVLGQLEQMTAGVAQHNQAMFELNKAASIGNAIVKTFEGFTQALAAYPPPISWAMAAVTLAAGLAQVSAIQSTSFGGGTTPSAAATPSYNGQPLYQQQTVAPTGQTANLPGGGGTQAQTQGVVINYQPNVQVGVGNAITPADMTKILNAHTADVKNQVNEALARGAIPG